MTKTQFSFDAKAHIKPPLARDSNLKFIRRNFSRVMIIIRKTYPNITEGVFYLLGYFEMNNLKN